MISIVLIILLVIFTLISMLSSASEIALFSLSPTTIRAYQKSQNARQQLIAGLVQRPRELFVTIFILNVTATILIQNTFSTLLGDIGSWWLNVGVPLIVVLLLGEILPKYIALQNNVMVADTLAPLVAFMSRILYPLRKIILMISVPVSRGLFFFLSKDTPVSKDEMDQVLQNALKFDVLNADEVKLASGYMELQGTQVKELMWPREDILLYDINKPLSKLLYLFSDEQCSRIPVCDEDIQNLKGIITATTYFLYRDQIQTPQDLLLFLDKAFFVPETTPLQRLVQQLNERNEEVALVVDEYGAIVGLITHEDIVEVVIGEIADQRDEKPSYTLASEDTMIASGKLELREFEDIFGIPLESETGVLTLGGWLIEHLGDIPKSGTKVQTEEFLFQVLAAEPNRIRRVYVRRLRKPKREQV